MPKLNLTSSESATFSRSKALGAAQFAMGGIQAMSIFMQAGIQKRNIDAALVASQAQREESARRHSINLRQLRKQAMRSMSGKKEAFIAGGVKLEGSAIDVVNDTLMDLLKAELNKEHEQAFINEQSTVQESNLRSQREQIDTVAIINATSSILGSAGGLM